MALAFLSVHIVHTPGTFISVWLNAPSMEPSNFSGGNNLRTNLMHTGDNDAPTSDFDFDVGYSQNAEDLDAIDTEYIESSKMPDLDNDTLNVLHLNI